MVQDQSLHYNDTIVRIATAAKHLHWELNQMGMGYYLSVDDHMSTFLKTRNCHILYHLQENHHQRV
jgi:hypothetical protein